MRLSLSPLSRIPKGVLLGFTSLALVVLIYPHAVSTFWIRIGTGVLMWVALAQSWNIIGGYTGYLNFGHGAFFGVGAYFTGITMRYLAFPFVLAIVLAGVVASLLAALIGAPTLRLRGAYFAIATWAFAEAVRQLVIILDITGGSYGFRLPPLLNERFFYYVMMGLALFTMAVTYLVVERSRFGLSLRAIRDGESAAQSLGIDTTAQKLKAFALSAFFPGILGGVYAYWLTYIHPNNVLAPLISGQMVVMTMVGGVGTFWGPALGAVVIQLANRLIWLVWGESVIYLILLGAAIGGVVLFMPEGLVGLLRRIRAKRSELSVPTRQREGAEHHAAES